MGKGSLRRRSMAKTVDSPAGEYKKRQIELVKKSSELQSVAISQSRKVSVLQDENNCWKERLILIEKDLSFLELSDNGKASLMRLASQAQNAFEITSEELTQSQELYAKIKTQQRGLSGAIKRLDNIQYELDVDADLQARRKGLGMANNNDTTSDVTGFLREIKQMEYTADALINLRTENGTK